MMSTTWCVAALVGALVVFMIGLLVSVVRNPFQTDDNYTGKAVIVLRLDDEEGGYLCTFSKDGKIYYACYQSPDKPLKEGDTVEIVWFGYHCKMPLVMDKKEFEKQTELYVEAYRNFR